MIINELRIGNYVEGIGMEEPIRKILDSIEYNYETEKYELDSLDIQNFKPIPLTEEWLKKFGFEESIAFLNKGKISIGNGGKLYFNSWYIIDTPKYVHQLQNLYFALTGEELKII